MDIHQTMQSAAELVSGKYQRDGDISIVHVPIQGGRWQIVYGKIREVEGTEGGLLFTKIGPNVAKADHEDLLRLNYHLQYSKVAINKDNIICIIAYFDLQKTTFENVVEIIREVAIRGDRLEKEIFMHDNS